MEDTSIQSNNSIETTDSNSSDNGVRLVLLGSRKTGLFKMLFCVCLFTEKEIVFAHFSSKKQKEIIKEEQARIKAEGKGFFKGTLELMKATNKYAQRYYTIPLNEVLQEDPNNFTVTTNNVEKIIFQKPNFVDYDDSSSKNPGKLTIKVSGQKYKITHDYSDNNKSIKNTLLGLFGNKFKYR
ncbi:MAG: hypothetical protein ACOWWH_10090 [Eubacteriaceae bacterium]